MKTKLLILTLLVALGSCGREVIETSGGNGSGTIGFTAHQSGKGLHASTRGTEIDIDNLQNFEVWTYADNDLYVGGEVTKIGSEWSYNGGAPKYWPAQKAIASYAIAPFEAGYNVTDPGNGSTAPAISYTLPGPGGDQTDLLFAAVQNYAAGTQAAGGVISEYFHHALSQISFKAYKAGGLTDDVSISSVTLNGLNNSGTASIETPVVWTTSGSENYTFNFLNGDLDNTAVDLDTATAIDAGVGAIFMMPQTHGAATIDIAYTIDGVPTTKEDIPFNVAWAPGSSYAIAFAISSSGVEIPEQQEFTESDTYEVPKDGYYYIEAWGGNGGNGGTTGQITGGTGGVASKTSGLYYFTAGQTIYVQVGSVGGNGGNSGYGNNFGTAGTILGATNPQNFGTAGNGGTGRAQGQTAAAGGGGGAASGVIVSGTVYLAAAGGGGGGGAGQYNIGGDGGASGQQGAGPINVTDGGGLGGQEWGTLTVDGTNTTGNGAAGGGGGGAGYSPNPNSSGSGAGGNSSSNGGAGGGGGYSYTSNEATDPGNLETPPTSTRPGTDGYVVITYLGE